MINRIGVLIILALIGSGCKSATAPAAKEFESHNAGDVVISLANEKGELAQGQNSFVIAFRSASKSEPVDTGKVTLLSRLNRPGRLCNITSRESSR